MFRTEHGELHRSRWNKGKFAALEQGHRLPRRVCRQRARLRRINAVQPDRCERLRVAVIEKAELKADAEGACERPVDVRPFAEP